jgi:hypothetical protein
LDRNWILLCGTLLPRFIRILVFVESNVIPLSS